MVFRGHSGVEDDDVRYFSIDGKAYTTILELKEKRMLFASEGLFAYLSSSRGIVVKFRISSCYNGANIKQIL